MHIVISGQTPAQKNRKKMSFQGGKPRLYTEAKVKSWQDQAAIELMPLRGKGFDERVSIVYMFYCKDNRRRDIDNMVASVNDALVKAGIVVDDSWQSLCSGGFDADIDKDNPRAEVWIDPIG